VFSTQSFNTSHTFSFYISQKLLSFFLDNNIHIYQAIEKKFKYLRTEGRKLSTGCLLLEYNEPPSALFQKIRDICFKLSSYCIFSTLSTFNSYFFSNILVLFQK